jgi:hypothetical protein
VPPVLRRAGFTAELRRQGCHSGSGCAVVLVPAAPPAQTFGNLMQSLDAAPYRGQNVRFRAWVRLEPVEPGDRAQLWLRVDLPGGQMGFFDNMGDRPISSSEWGRHEITGAIDAGAQSLNIGIMSLGKGRAWLDDVSLEIVPRASEAETSAAREAIERLYAHIDAAYQKGDINAIAGLVLPDATLSTPGGGTMPLRTLLEQIRVQIQGGTRITSRSRVTAVRVSEGNAEVTVENQGS